MRFATRTFLWSFLPFTLLLLASFAAIQTMVQSTVHERLRASLRDTHSSIARIRAKSELQNSRFLRIIAENASLKAGLELLAEDTRNQEARATLEDRLFEICQQLDFDFLMASDAAGTPLAGVRRSDRGFRGIDPRRFRPPQQGFASLDGIAYQVTSSPVNQGDESIGLLTLGELFQFSEFTTPTLLTHHGRLIESNLASIPRTEIEAAVQACRGQNECEIRLRNETYLSLPLESIYFGEGWMLRSLQNVDSAIGPVEAILRKVFLIAALGALLAAIVICIYSSRSIVLPIAKVVEHLRQSESTGFLPQFDQKPTNIQEIRDLTAGFNRAAASILEARSHLEHAYVDFVGALASALDARDRYTAGHSRRVSDYSVELGASLHLPESMLEQIRIGALLHDIGKIGIPDSVLQKPGSLTPEEYALIQHHPAIGRRILELVRGFEPYLKIVELHHENWDGSGYPWGLARDAVPLDARIVHIADAYDAMTSDRPYRAGMSHDEALSRIRRASGTQFDPTLVSIFSELTRIARQRAADGDIPAESLQNLAESVREHAAPTTMQSRLREEAGQGEIHS